MITLFIGNLHQVIGKENLEAILKEYGAVENTRIIPCKDKEANYAFAEVRDEDVFVFLEALNGAILYDKRLHVKRALSKPSMRSYTISRLKSLKRNAKERKNYSNKKY